VATPLPLDSDGLSTAEQREVYRRVSIDDRLVVPEEFRADLIAAWGDPLANGRFGFNNDYLGFVALGTDRALLSVNFEYISPRPWADGFADVIAAPLPWQALVDALASRGGVIDASALESDDPLLDLIRAVSDRPWLIWESG
jgi:secreted PhoX family phosphatase